MKHFFQQDNTCVSDSTTPEDQPFTVLLANMGAPSTKKAMKVFLKLMFSDKAIIYAPAFVRFFASVLISNLRYKSSWKKYVKIGGSPLQKSMVKIAHDLKSLLSDKYTVSCAYSYSEPFIQNELARYYTQGIRQFVVISMYPQSSYSTTGSVQASLLHAQKQFPDIQIHFVEDYFDHTLFVKYWVELIQHEIAENSYQKPYLLFSAHALPLSFVKRGDLYVQKVEQSAQCIANVLDIAYSLSYQSKVGATEWTRPYTKDQLKVLKDKGISEIIVVPISFVNENLETLYDLDTEIIPYAKNILKIENISRIKIPNSDKILVKMFYELVVKKMISLE